MPWGTFAFRNTAGVAAAVALVVLSVARLPGQATASATRWWLFLGMLPLAMGLTFQLWRDLYRVRSVWPWLVLMVIAVVQAPLLIAPGRALWLGLWCVGLITALLLGTRVQSDEEPLLHRSSMFAGVLAALSSFAPWWGIGGSFGNPDLLAGFLVLTILFSVPVLTQRTKRTRPVETGTWAFCMVFQCAVLLRCDSLGALWALCIGGAVYACFWGRNRSTRTWSVVFVASVAMLATLAWLQRSQLSSHFEGRWYMMKLSAQIISDNPWGVGAGGFPLAWMETQANHFEATAAASERGLWTHAHHAHNELLHISTELGVMGGLLWLLPLLLALRRRFGEPATFSVCIAWLCLSMVSLPLYEPATAFLAALSVGLLLRPSEASETPPHSTDPSSRSTRLTAVVAAIVVGSSAVFASADWMSDRLLYRGVQESDESILMWSRDLSLRSSDDAARLLADVLEEEDPVAAYRLVKAHAPRDPSPVVWLQVGRLAVLSGHEDEAIVAMEEAIRLHPWFFSAYFNLSLVWEARGDHARAIRYAERARSLRPWDPRLHVLPM